MNTVDLQQSENAVYRSEVCHLRIVSGGVNG